jgi:hemin uptake protein HemP
MTRPTRQGADSAATLQERPSATGASVVRLKSDELFKESREIEIDHEGRIYRLRLTQLNKLILTA